eukprot:TRINITY_DN4095_c0_g1_i9.p1 TRINITY_DN4095_c0_g1~~TRINITY_DN4095_c0_g1_i9.p1  ORF type:complete len:874 (+),score=261.88 TRINITY_DN4095_c0_g1_i9:376-2997(+)
MERVDSGHNNTGVREQNPLDVKYKDEGVVNEGVFFIKDCGLDEDENFDGQLNPMDIIPPNFELCELHRQANFMRKPVELSTEKVSGKTFVDKRCQCCNRSYNTELYKLCDPSKDFANHGFGITLYFAMMKHMIYLSGIIFVWCVVMFIIYLNGGITEGHLTNSNDDIETGERVAGKYYYDSFANKLSLGRILGKEVTNVVVLGLVLLILFFYFPFIQFKAKLNGMAVKLNNNNLTPADYTVMLSGIPISEMTDEEIKEEFESFMKLNIKSIPIKVRKVVPVYDLTYFIKLENEYQITRREKIVIENKRRLLREKEPSLTEEELQNKYPQEYESAKYNEIREKVLALKKDMKNAKSPENSSRLKILFVTFTNTAANEIVEKYQVGMLRYMFNKSDYSMRNQNVMILPAPEPEDVKWENLSYSFANRFVRIVINGFITLCLLGICLTANIFISKASKELTKEDKDTHPWALIALNLAFSLITTCINSVLTMVIPILTRYEYLESQTSYYCSVAIKLSVALFLNSGIIPIITYVWDTYFTYGGFVMTVWTNWLFICFLNPVLEVFDVWYIFAWVMWKWTKSKGEESTLTQHEANIALEPYEVSVVTKFSQMINIIFYTSFYVILFPFGILITILGFLFQYWVSKVLMVYRYKVPRFGNEIALRCMDFVGVLFPILCLISGEIFMARFKTDTILNYEVGLTIPILLLVVLFLVSYILSYNKDGHNSIFFRIFVGDDSLLVDFHNKFKDVEYDPFYFGASDYKIANPITKDEGITELMKYCTENIEYEEDKEFIETIKTNLVVAQAHGRIGYGAFLKPDRYHVQDAKMAPQAEGEEVFMGRGFDRRRRRRVYKHGPSREPTMRRKRPTTRRGDENSGA